MPRPSLKDQRTGEILDAYLTCVARFGLEGATQERIATEAGVKRPLLRHYLGNKDQMIAALQGHVVEGFASLTQKTGEALADLQNPGELVEFLFAEKGSTDPRLMLAWQALTASVVDYPENRDPLLVSIEGFLDMIETTLRRMVPGVDEALLRAVTQGIASPYINLDALAPLDPPEGWRSELKQAALILARSLEDSA